MLALAGRLRTRVADRLLPLSLLVLLAAAWSALASIDRRQRQRDAFLTAVLSLCPKEELLARSARQAPAGAGQRKRPHVVLTSNLTASTVCSASINATSIAALRQGLAAGWLRVPNCRHLAVRQVLPMFSFNDSGRTVSCADILSTAISQPPGAAAAAAAAKAAAAAAAAAGANDSEASGAPMTQSQVLLRNFSIACHCLTQLLHLTDEIAAIGGQFGQLLEQIYFRKLSTNRTQHRLSMQLCRKAYEDWACSVKLQVFNLPPADEWPPDRGSAEQRRLQQRQQRQQQQTPVQPCRGWCQAVETECPYLTPSESVSNGGEPVFLCHEDSYKGIARSDRCIGDSCCCYRRDQAAGGVRFTCQRLTANQTSASGLEATAASNSSSNSSSSSSSSSSNSSSTAACCLRPSGLSVLGLFSWLAMRYHVS